MNITYAEEIEFEPVLIGIGEHRDKMKRTDQKALSSDILDILEREGELVDTNLHENNPKIAIISYNDTYYLTQLSDQPRQKSETKDTSLDKLRDSALAFYANPDNYLGHVPGRYQADLDGAKHFIPDDGAEAKKALGLDF